MLLKSAKDDNFGEDRTVQKMLIRHLMNSHGKNTMNLQLEKSLLQIIKYTALKVDVERSGDKCEKK